MILSDRAEHNLAELGSNSYPGRGIVLGCNKNGGSVQIYWLMGRSEGSRNRVLEEVPEKHGWVRTRVADPRRPVGDPEMTLYNAMAEGEWHGLRQFAVSNGRQTDKVLAYNIEVLLDGSGEYEDEPNCTPRITGVTSESVQGGIDTRIVILKKSLFDTSTDYLSFGYNSIETGYGLFISTYDGDGNPLPAFSGEPMVMPIRGITAEEIAREFWEYLNEGNRVSIAVKVIAEDQPSEVAIINQYDVVD